MPGFGSTFALYLRLFGEVEALKARMSQFDTDVATLQATLNKLATDLPAVAGAITDQKNQIIALQTQLANAGLSPAQQTALDNLVTQAGALETQAAALVAPPGT